MILSRRTLLASGGALGLAGPGFADTALGPGFSGLQDQYVVPKDPGLKSYLATQPQLIVPADAPSMGMVAPRGEPGERMIVAGRITDGRTPIQGVGLYIYNTDATGSYNPNCPGCGNRLLISRLHAAIRTDAQGRYQFETIRPGPYGGGEAHIHVVISTEENGWQFEMTFDDDPVAKAWMDGTKTPPPYVMVRAGVSIRHPTRDSKGIWHVTQDIVLRS
jgi:protocatechuate 3,4-dioxygenase beta subunit